MTCQVFEIIAVFYKMQAPVIRSRLLPKLFKIKKNIFNIIVRLKSLIPHYSDCIFTNVNTALQAGRSRVRFPMVSLEFFIDINLLTALWP